MKKYQLKQNCPNCRQASGVDIIYGDVDELSEILHSALTNGDVVLGGTSRKWDWEEELIDTRCLRCKHMWHSWHKTLAETSQAGSMSRHLEVENGSAGQAGARQVSRLPNHLRVWAITQTLRHPRPT